MPKVDLTVTISVILGCAAVLAPIFTALINNHHENYLRREDRKEQRYKETVLYKRSVLENYLQRASVYVQTHDYVHLPAYAEAYSLAVLYVSTDVLRKMEHLDYCISEHKFDDLYNVFIEVHTDLISILQTM